MIRLTTPLQPTLPSAPLLRTQSSQAAGAPFEERWLSAVASITGIMIVMFCAVIMLAADRSSQSTRDSGEPSKSVPTAPAPAVGDAVDGGG